MSNDKHWNGYGRFADGTGIIAIDVSEDEYGLTVWEESDNILRDDITTWEELEREFEAFYNHLPDSELTPLDINAVKDYLKSE